MLIPLPTFRSRLIQETSGSYPGQLWIDPDRSKKIQKRSGNADHGAETVNRF